jgi:hypothetical protein
MSNEEENKPSMMDKAKAAFGMGQEAPETDIMDDPPEAPEAPVMEAQDAAPVSEPAAPDVKEKPAKDSEIFYVGKFIKTSLKRVMEAGWKEGKDLDIEEKKDHYILTIKNKALMNNKDMGIVLRSGQEAYRKLKK